MEVEFSAADGPAHLRLRSLDELLGPGTEDLVTVGAPTLDGRSAVQLREFDLPPVLPDCPLDVFQGRVSLKYLTSDVNELTGQLLDRLIVLSIASVKIFGGVNAKTDAVLGVSYADLDADREQKNGVETVHLTFCLDLPEGERYLTEGEDAGDVEVRPGACLPQRASEELTHATLVGAAGDELDVPLDHTKGDYEHGYCEDCSPKTEALVGLEVEQVCLTHERCNLCCHGIHLPKVK